MKKTSIYRLLIVISLAFSLVLVQPAGIGRAQDVQGYVLAWGDNTFGELGYSTTDARSILVETSGLSNITQIAPSDGYNLAFKSDGTVLSWGNNSNGQLGDGITTDRHTPVQVSG